MGGRYPRPGLRPEPYDREVSTGAPLSARRGFRYECVCAKKKCNSRREGKIRHVILKEREEKLPLPTCVVHGKENGNTAVAPRKCTW